MLNEGHAIRLQHPASSTQHPAPSTQHPTFNIQHLTFRVTSIMYREHVYWHSPSLGRDMEFAWYGKFGRPVMLFPTSSGRYSENEDRGMPEPLAAKVNGGEI